MPIFHKEKIVFIHIPKNAGMYVEKILGVDAELRDYSKPTDKPSTFGLLKSRYKTMKLEHNKELKLDFLYGAFGGQVLMQHMSLSELVNTRLITEDIISSYGFYFVHRHPLERCISIYKYWGFEGKMSFHDFCVKYVENPAASYGNFPLLTHLRTQSSFIQIPDNYSRIKPIGIDLKDLDTFLLSIGKHSLGKRVNSSKEFKVRVEKRSIEIVERVYREDYENFGY